MFKRENFLKVLFIEMTWQLKRGGIPTVRNSEKLTNYNTIKLNKSMADVVQW